MSNKLDKVKLRIKLINEGNQIKPSRYLNNGNVMLSFSLPKPTMKRYQQLVHMYGSGPELMENLVSMFNVRTTRHNGKIILARYLSEYATEEFESPSYKHKDYKFTSLSVSEAVFDKVEAIKTYYGISRSAVVRLMVEAV